MLKVVTLLSTLKDPTQIRRQPCTNRQHPKEFVCFFLSNSHMTLATKKVHGTIAQKEEIDWTKKSTASSQKKWLKGVRGFCT